MFSEHDDKLNENQDAFMSVEAKADAEAAAAEAGDESSYFLSNRNDYACMNLVAGP